MNDLRKTAQQALEALALMVAMEWSPEFTRREYDSDVPGENELRDKVLGCITDLRAALEQSPLTFDKLSNALVASRVIDPAAIDDPEGYDDGVMLERVRGLHRRLAALVQPEQEPVALFTKYGPPTMRDRDFWSAGYAAGAARAIEQEPVTWGVDWGRDGDRPCCTIIKRHADGTQEVVAVEYAPPRREWKSLTNEEIGDVFQAARNAKLGSSNDNSRHRLSVVEIARAVEQALKEKNHE